MLHSLSLRWKILLALLSLSFISLAIILPLFSGMVNQLQQQKRDHLTTLSSQIALQSLSDLEQLFLAQLLPLGKDESLAEATELLLQLDDPSQLQLQLQQMLLAHDLDKSELLLPNGRLYRLEKGKEREGLQKLQLSKEQAQENSFSAPAKAELQLKEELPGLTVGLPVVLGEQVIARLIATRYIDDKMVAQLPARVGAELAFHDGEKIIAVSQSGLKNISLATVLKGGHISLDDTPYSIHPFSYDAGGKNGLLLIVDETHDLELAADFRKQLLSAALAVLLLATVAALILSRKISGPLQQVIDTLSEISDGETGQISPLPPAAENEIGVLSASLNRLISSLHDSAIRTRTTSQSLTRAIEKLREHATEVNDGADRQSSSMENAHRAITEIGKAAEGIAENVSNLVASVQESAAATHQFGSTTLSISQQMENLFGTVSNISSSIQQLSGSNEQIDHNLNDLYSGAQKTVLSIEQLEEATGAIEEGAKQTSLRAEESAAQALDGKAAVQDTIRGISGLQQLIEQAHKTILDLGERSDAIGSIVNVIADVADQTNLLALNAAIIAAQAGDHGQGFAVVAEEIRGLAERTTTSASEITRIINNLQSGTRAAVDAIEAGSARAKQEVAHSHAAGQMLEKLHEGALESTEQVQIIVEQTRKQSEESRNIALEVTGITNKLQQIANAMRQQTESTRQMAEAAKSMTNIAAKVKMSTDEQSRGGQQIAQSTEHIQQMIEQIDAATQDQSLRSKMVVEAVSSVRKIAEENTVRSAEMNQVVESLAEHARDLCGKTPAGTGAQD